MRLNCARGASSAASSPCSVSPSRRNRWCQGLQSKFFNVIVAPVLCSSCSTMYCRARVLNASDSRYARKAPAATVRATTVIPRKMRIRRLVKYLNIAPSADRLEPDRNLVVQAFLQDVGSDQIGYLGERRSRIHAPLLPFRYKNVAVILLDIDV